MRTCEPKGHFWYDFLMTLKKVVWNGARTTGNPVYPHGGSSFIVITAKSATWRDVQVVCHFKKLSGNSGWFVNGTRLFGSFHWKISGSSGTSEKVVPFSSWKLCDGNVFHLQVLKGLTSFRLFKTKCLILARKIAITGRRTDLS